MFILHISYKAYLVVLQHVLGEDEVVDEVLILLHNRTQQQQQQQKLLKTLTLKATTKPKATTNIIIKIATTATTATITTRTLKYKRYFTTKHDIFSPFNNLKS